MFYVSLFSCVYVCVCLESIWPQESHKEEQNAKRLLYSLCNVVSVAIGTLCLGGQEVTLGGAGILRQRALPDVMGAKKCHWKCVYDIFGQDIAACQQTRLHQSRPTLIDLLIHQVM